MTLQDEINGVTANLSADRQRQLLDFARYLSELNDREQFYRAGMEHFATAYGDNEPEYTLADLRREIS